jgi:hypothetical protein
VGALAARRRGAVAMLGVLLLAALVAGCVAGRERIDSPRITLVVDDSTVAPGGSVRGTLTGVDATGLTTLAVFLCTRDSTFRERLDFVRQDSATIDFEFPLPESARANDPLEVQAVAFDDQNFVVDTATVLYVRASGTEPGPPPFAGAGLCSARDEPLP